MKVVSITVLLMSTLQAWDYGTDHGASWTQPNCKQSDSNP